ncbi:MAG: hypothetical protein JSR37_07480 [Verrucomicrobia bacterium]|nr:hypothetical protein [Verrucomicrobiota bacterium]MBS0636000.1 hypothetical protein [Verrucomicrobiota bacterium]
MMIYDGPTVQPGYSSCIVTIDARPSSSLNWNTQIEQTKAIIEMGSKVCFELDLGLFTPPFTYSQGLFQTIVLAIDEFRGRLLEPFEEHVEAVILYRSSGNFASVEERDVVMDYLDLLRHELPEELPVLLLFKSCQDPFEFCRLFSPDRFSLFTLCLEDAPLFTSCCAWNRGKGLLGYIGKDLATYKPEKCSKGLILPRFTNNMESHRDFLASYNRQDFKIISEELLSNEWEGLDILYVLEPQNLAPTTQRMLEGFQAAGGVVDLNPLKSI